MEKPFFDSLFRAPIKAFSTHLDSEINERIIISGKYGSGKTTFLQKYFKLEEVNQRYDIYHLFPVNYSIASNEDIIGYIKYDIVLEMLRKELLLTEEMKSYIRTLPAYVVKNLDKVMAAIVGMVPVIGKSVLEMYEPLKKLVDEYLAFHDDRQERPGDDLIAFIDEQEARSHSIVENDTITKIMAKVIESRSPKKSVLIVDDLDRLDPEHVFRIFNVFAAQFDGRASTRDSNKFGFDKVIMVCDVHNIRHIFHHRYGAEVDFIGYMDKFFSSDIYFFENSYSIRDIVNEILSRMVFGPDNQLRDLYTRNKFIEAIIDSLVKNNLISLRALVKLWDTIWNLHDETIELGPYGRTLKVWELPILIQIKVLTQFLGDFVNAWKVISRCNELRIEPLNTQRYFGIILYALFERYDEPNLTWISFDGQDLVLTPQRNSSSLEVVLVHRMAGWEDEDKTKPKKGDILTAGPSMFWPALLGLMQKLHEKRYLH